MKNLILIISLFSNFAYAGNGSGTLGLISSNNESVKYVKFVSMDRADLIFEYGEVNSNNELNTQLYKARREEFSSEESNLLKAIDFSKATNDWQLFK